MEPLDENRQPPAVRVRKAQEELTNLIDAGSQKVIADWHWTLFNEYIKRGFERNEALELIKASIHEERRNQ